jgi:uncharacterized membrane protein YgaE (UPF0421/DUF939 family)
MLTQIDVSRLPSYQWGWEDSQKQLAAIMAEKDTALQEKDTALQEKDTALQEKDTLLQQTLQEKAQQTARLVRKIHLSGMEATQIADFLEMPLAEVVALLGDD